MMMVLDHILRNILHLEKYQIISFEAEPTFCTSEMRYLYTLTMLSIPHPAHPPHLLPERTISSTCQAVCLCASPTLSTQTLLTEPCLAQPLGNAVLVTATHCFHTDTSHVLYRKTLKHSIL